MARRYASGYDSLPDLSGPLHVSSAERSYAMQFAQIYDYRLSVLRRRVLTAATEQFGEKPPQRCFVIGTLYAHMKHKPDVLQEIAREASLPPQQVVSYADPEYDELYIEDQSGRVRLVGARDRMHCVTGAVVGVLGIETPDGDLDVLDMVAPGPPPPLSLGNIPQRLPDAPGAPSIVLTSGLCMGNAAPEQDMYHALLLEYLTGELGTPEMRAQASCISSIVLAGDSVRRAAWCDPIIAAERQKHRAAMQSPFADLDPVLEELCATLDSVILMPGMQDPSSATMPQQPLLRALMPRAARWSSLECVTNPAWFMLHGRIMLGTAGQNVADLVKYAPEAAQSIETAMEMARATLEWSHVAPTAPDTLWCYPFKHTDPFVLRAAPDVYIVGNQAAHAHSTMNTKRADGTLHTIHIILVPDFSQTHEVVLLNMETLASHPVAFQA
ncbi:hypothetical protein MVES_003214 [Malassezia vespertilionis]|uniref:Pol31p n=1 Tax=Malassezia vespertilionis TaxID=2020962 RepID=A0A2N1J8K9_9BASI|nr:hypothetical protein MVES_003214 [Malassezia vespertilionis]